jgi:hypothetical protein
MDLSWRCRFQSLVLDNPNDGSHDAWCQIKGSSTPAHDKFPRPEYIDPTPSLDSNYLIILSEKKSIARPIQAEIKILILAFHSTRASSCSDQSSLWGVGPLQGRTVASGELLKEEVEKLTSLAAPLFFFFTLRHCKVTLSTGLCFLRPIRRRNRVYALYPHRVILENKKDRLSYALSLISMNFVMNRLF